MVPPNPPIRCAYSDTRHRQRLKKLRPFWTQVLGSRLPRRLGKYNEDYLWDMVKTPSQLEGGSSKRYSWQRFQ